MYLLRKLKTTNTDIRYSNLEKRIKFYKTKHGGVSAARNFALDVSNGDCVFFLDSDDVIHPHLLEKLVKGIVDQNSDISITDLLHIPNQGWHKLKDYIKLYILNLFLYFYRCFLVY